MPGQARFPDFGCREEQQQQRSLSAPSALPQPLRRAGRGRAARRSRESARGGGRTDGPTDGAGLRERRADGGEGRRGRQGGGDTGGIREQSREESCEESREASRKAPRAALQGVPGARPGSFRSVGKWTLRGAGRTRSRGFVLISPSVSRKGCAASAPKATFPTAKAKSFVSSCASQRLYKQ